jgi:thymidylate kinase
MTRFWTVLGADYSGKSAVLHSLRCEHGWQVVSYDDPYVEPFPLVRWLREVAFFEAYRQRDVSYSGDLAFSLLTPIVLHLRDEVIGKAARGPAIVDSYYYKLLAKGIITGIADEKARAAWRSAFQPEPRGVIFLDVDPDVAWDRANGKPNPFEYHGHEPTRDGFRRFQRDLRDVMLDEINGLPHVVVDANCPVAHVTAAVQAGLSKVGYRQLTSPARSA